jgi:hypothetical protein
MVVFEKKGGANQEIDLGRCGKRVRFEQNYHMPKLFMKQAQTYSAVSMAKIIGEPGKTALKFCQCTSQKSFSP